MSNKFGSKKNKSRFASLYTWVRSSGPQKDGRFGFSFPPQTGCVPSPGLVEVDRDRAVAQTA